MNDREKQVLQETQNLLTAAGEYAQACDEGNYPAFQRCVEEMKRCARRLRWASLGIEGDPRKKPDSKASRDERKRKREERRLFVAVPK